MKNHKLILSVILIILAVSFRTIWHIGDNVEFVTTAALAAGAYLGLGYSFYVPLASMVVSDILIGTTNIFVFTWSAYAVIGMMGYIGFKNQKAKIKKQNYKFRPKADQPLAEKFKIDKIIKATGLSIIASFWFFLWTNFGVWVLDSWGMYTKDLQGLLSAYIMGLPFLKFNLIGNLFFVPLTFLVLENAPVILDNLNLKTLKAVKFKN